MVGSLTLQGNRNSVQFFSARIRWSSCASYGESCMNILSSIMIGVLLLPVTSFAASLVDPPVWNMWAFAELTSASPSEGDSASEACGDKVEVLFSWSRQISTEGLSDSDQERYGIIAQRFRNDFEEAAQEQRLRLLGDLLSVSGSSTRDIKQTWVRIDSMIVHYVRVFDQFTGNFLVKIEDETTGVYIGLLEETRNKGNSDLIMELLEEGTAGERAPELFEAIKKGDKGQTVRIDANGVVFFFDGNEPELLEENKKRGFQGMWQYLPENEGRRRLEMAIPVIWEAMENDDTFRNFHLEWFTDPQVMQVDRGLFKCGASFRNGSKGGDLVSLEAPPDEILEDFFGKAVLPLPDADWTFKKLAKKIL